MDLYYRAASVQELLVHRVAEETGAYREAGADVTLKDGSGPNWPTELEAEAPLTIGVGGAIPSRLVGKVNWAVVCVNNQYPTFWLVARPEIDAIPALAGKQVAGPQLSGPGGFARIIFRRHGVDLEKDCGYVAVPDAHRQRVVDMLTEGQADAVIVGTSQAPFALERAGFKILTFLGAEFQSTAVGVAVNQDVVAANAPEVLRIVEGTKKALARLHTDRDLVVRLIQEIQPDTTKQDAEILYDRYIHPYWTRDGRPDRAIAEASLRELAGELRVERVPAFEDLYKVP